MAGEAFLGVAVEFAELDGARFKKRADFSCDVFGEKKRNGYGYNKNEEQKRRNLHHHDEGADYRYHACANLQKVGGEGCVYSIDVVGEMAHDFARLMRIKIAYGHVRKA